MLARLLPVLIASLAAAVANGQSPESPATAPVPGRIGGWERVHPLQVGDPAPPLRIEEWVKGSPVPRFEPGHVYVIDCWATWCTGCVAEFPELSALQKDRAGKVTLIALTRPDEHNSLTAVRDMTAARGGAMGFTVAWDQDLDTWRAYMRASGQKGIPVQFVVGGDGRLAAVTDIHGTRRVVDALLAGSFDARPEAQAYAKAAVAWRDCNAWVDLMHAGKFEEAKQTLPRVLAGPANDDPGALSMIVWELCWDRTPKEHRDIAQARRLGERAIAMPAAADNVDVHCSLAEACFKGSDVARATTLLERAREISARAGNQTMVDILGRDIERYRSAAGSAAAPSK